MIASMTFSPKSTQSVIELKCRDVNTGKNKPWKVALGPFSAGLYVEISGYFVLATAWKFPSRQSWQL
jgi:hypothetical protein